MTQVPDPPDLMTVAEVATAARVSDETVHRWAREKKIPFIELPSGLKRFPRAEIEAMLRGESPATIDAA